MDYWDEYSINYEAMVNNVTTHNIVPDWHIISVAEYANALKECAQQCYDDVDVQYTGLSDLEYYEQWLQHKK